MYTENRQYFLKTREYDNKETNKYWNVKKTI